MPKTTNVKPRRRYNRRPKRTYTRKSGKKDTFASRVRKAITSFAEKKQFTTTQVNSSVVTGDNSVLVSNISLCPILISGTLENQRIGNSVRVSRGVISGYINMLPYSAITNTFPNLKVRLMLVSYRNRNVSALSAPNLVVGDFDTFFDNGSNGNSLQGTMYDILAPVNTQRWTLHSQRILDLSLAGSSTAYGATTVPHESGKYQKYFKFNFGKHLGKLTFDDSVGSNYPTNKNLFLLIQPVTSDGSSRQSGPIAECHYKMDIHYTDI